MKSILVLSPQGWGDCFVAKHNYAVALSRSGHKITFVNPPVIGKAGSHFSTAPDYPEIEIFHYGLPKLIYIASFKCRPLYNYYIKNKVVDVLAKHRQWDEVWCFDPGSFKSLDGFAAKKKILFIVDKPAGKHLASLASSADAVISIAEDILNVFRDHNNNTLLLDHGLAESFAAKAQSPVAEPVTMQRTGKQVNVGYVGNLLRGDILDKKAIIAITRGHPDIQFHFWGPYERAGNNLGGTVSANTLELIEYLKRQKNVRLYGPQPQAVLAREMQAMDAFIIPHNNVHDVNRGSNLHKIIEYLSTGKVIISTTITRYMNTGLLQMCETIEEFPSLFSGIISELDSYNADPKQQQRRTWALQHTYHNNVLQVWNFVYN